MKMGWKNWPGWLKGGLIGVGIMIIPYALLYFLALISDFNIKILEKLLKDYLILFFVVINSIILLPIIFIIIFITKYSGINDIWFINYIDSGNYFPGYFTFLGLLFGVLFYFILGALIGLLIGRIKLKSKKK